ncbi:MAG: hypothetical protein U5R31_15390 [Acidimicrobiia bacterium]|nr:hypothetical protein [Acidimicrobiia bacterium]
MPPETFDAPAARLWSCRIQSLNARSGAPIPAKYKAAILAEYEQLDEQGEGEAVARARGCTRRR